MHHNLLHAIANDPHLKNGFYIFDNKIYLSKIEALIEATKKGSDIRYYYNDHIYSNVDWSIEPTTSLVDLYKKQAQHIRDSYDHVILMFSGGSDSTTMLHSFLDNNILLDEIWSLGADTNTSSATDLTNIEITLAAMPKLKQASKLGIHVEIINMKDFDSPLEDDWWLDATGVRLTHDTMIRKNVFLNNPKIQKLVDQGKRVAFVFGYDKPRLLIDNKHWYIGILDTFWSHHWKSQHSMTNGPFFEFFYYAPESPEILSKSCHKVIQYFESIWSTDKCVHFFNVHNFRGEPLDINLYRRIVNTTLYNHCWDEFNTFSLGKSRGIYNQFNDQKCVFISNYSNHWDNNQTWIRGINELQKTLDPKFYTPWSQVIGHWTQLYPIKPVQGKINA